MRILIIAHDFPPLNSSASRRPYSWARAWSALGHDVQVLTTAKYATDGRADLALDCGGFGVREVPYLPLARISAGPAGAGAAGGAPPSLLFDLVRRSTRRLRLGLGIYTQTTMLAWRALLRAALRMHAERRFDFVISTSGPEVCTIVAHAFARRTGTPWIADYRDLWFAEFAVQRYAFTTWSVGVMNARMLRLATAASTISEGLAGYLKRVTDRPVLLSYNGYLEEAPGGELARPWRDSMRHLVYTGNFYPDKRDPESLFGALRELLAIDPRLHQRLRLDLYGPAEDWVQAKIAAHGLQPVVRVHGMVAYQESLSAQRAADALLFVDWMDARAEGVLTGKLFEYLSSGRPILCVGNRAGTEAAKLIAQSGAGRIANEPAAIRAALAAVAAGDAGPGADRAAIARFSRRAQAEDLLGRIRALLPAAG